MHRNVYAWTAPGSNYPEYLSLNHQDDGTYTLDMRSPGGDSSAKTLRVVMTRKEMGLMARAMLNEIGPQDLVP